MAISKTEINLRRLLVAAPQQQNQAKLIHYVTTMRELLEQVAEEMTPDGLPRISKAMVNDYSEKIECIASKLAAPVDMQERQEPFAEKSYDEISQGAEEKSFVSPPRLRKRSVPSSHTDIGQHDNVASHSSMPIKLDVAARTRIEKHRELQEELTDEMVGLARQLKESSLLMSRSVQNTEKILDSTEKAVEHSLASTGHATSRAMKVYSESSKTSCLTWLVMLVMTCIFIMVVLLIRVT